jgi:hypothetical protein
LLGVAAAVAGREPRVPSMGEEFPGYDLPTLDEALTELANTDLVSPPVKVQVFSAVYAQHDRSPGLEHLAASLLRPDLTADEQSEPVDRIFALASKQPVPWGRDPFQRRPSDLVQEPFIPALRPEVLNTVVQFDSVDCGASVVLTENTHALSIATEVYTVDPLASLVDILDPRSWPKCQLQHLFFRSMTEVAPLHDLDPPDRSQPPPPQPLNNWKGRLREVVDWSMGAGWVPFTTDLDVVFFNSPERAGCTYDIGPPVDHQVVVDRGYLLAEDVGTLRRVRTLKQVHFAVGDLDPDFLCFVWGPVTQLLAWACIGHIHPLPH